MGEAWRACVHLRTRSCREFAGLRSADTLPLGFPDRALAQIEQLTALADRLSHPFSLGNALTFGAAITYQMRRQADRVEKCASAGLLLADKYGFLLRKAQATVMQGWAMAQRSLYDRGISLIQEGMETWDATGAEAARSYHFGLLADAYRLASCPQLGLQATRRGLDSTHRTGERWWLPELHRLQGELQWAAGTNGEAAEASFRQVLEESNQHKAPISPAAGSHKLGSPTDPTRKAVRRTRAACEGFPPVRRRIRHTRSAGGSATAGHRPNGLTPTRALTHTGQEKAHEHGQGV